MSAEQTINELGRNMDTVYDSLFVLNAAVTAIVQSLPKSSALQLVPALEAVFSQIHHLENPPEEFALMRLKALRNVVADIAELPATAEES